MQNENQTLAMRRMRLLLMLWDTASLVEETYRHSWHKSGKRLAKAIRSFQRKVADKEHSKPRPALTGATFHGAVLCVLKQILGVLLAPGALDIKALESLRGELNAALGSEEDFVDEVIAERIKANPDFRKTVAEKLNQRIGVGK